MFHTDSTLLMTGRLCVLNFCPLLLTVREKEMMKLNTSVLHLPVTTWQQVFGCAAFRSLCDVIIKHTACYNRKYMKPSVCRETLRSVALCHLALLPLKRTSNRGNGFQHFLLSKGTKTRSGHACVSLYQ